MKQLSLPDRMMARLRKLGLSERVAKNVVKGLAPTVRAAIKAVTEAKRETLEYLPTNKPFTRGKAVKVNSHLLRLDLSVVPVSGTTGVELLRVMDGLSTQGTYLVAAVRSDKGIVAVRQLGTNYYNVKFYPDMAYWKKDSTTLTGDFGASDHLKRDGLYERMHFNRDGLDLLLQELAAEAKPKSRMKGVMDRFLTVASKPLLASFDYLSGVRVRFPLVRQ